MDVTQLQMLLLSLGGVEGAGTLAVVVVIVQALMVALRGKLGKVAGKHKMTIVLLLTVVSGVVGLMVQGVSYQAAIMHSSVAASLQVLLNQVNKQYLTDKGNK